MQEVYADWKAWDSKGFDVLCLEMNPDDRAPCPREALVTFVLRGTRSHGPYFRACEDHESRIHLIAQDIAERNKMPLLTWRRPATMVGWDARREIAAAVDKARRAEYRRRAAQAHKAAQAVEVGGDDGRA